MSAKAKVKVCPKDFINSAKHFNGNIFEWDLKNASDNITNQKGKGGKQQIFDATWIPILFKKVDDKGDVTKVPVYNYDVDTVLNCSKPSKPSFGDEDNGQKSKVKVMLLAFKRVTLEEVMTGDYVPKDKETKEEQAVENKRMRDLAQKLCDNTNEFLDAQDAIDEGFKQLFEYICEQFVNDPDQFKFNMAKESNWVIKDKKGDIKMFNPPFRSIKQTHRKDVNNPNKMIPLDTPLYRIKLPVVDNKMQLAWPGKEPQDYIFDMRKTMTDKKSKQPKLVEAKIKNAAGTMQSLNVDNVDKFITPRSILNFRLSLPKIAISKAGFSLVNEVKQMIVKRHKSSTSQRDACISNETLSMMQNADSDDEEVSEEVPELDVTPTPAPVVAETDGNITDSSEEGNKEVKEVAEEEDDDDDDDEEEEVVKPVPKKTSKRVSAKKPATKKPTKKVVKKQESDDEDDDSDV